MNQTETNTQAPSRIGLLVKRIIFLLLPVLILVGSVVGFIGMSALKPKPEEKAEVIEALPVVIATAKMQPVSITVQAQGEVVPRSEVSLASEVSGKVTYISPKFLAGGDVSKGETLVRIAPTEYELRAVQAEAAVAQARTALAQEVSEGQIAAQGAADLGIDDVSELTLRRPQLAQAQANLASAEARLDEAKLQLARTSIRAPFNGRVRNRAISLGAVVSTGTTLGQIYASDVVDVPLPLTDTDLQHIGLGIGYIATPDKPGPDVQLTATVAGEVHQWTGQITRTDSGFDPESRVLFAYVEVSDPYGKGADDGVPLAPGLFVTATVDGSAITESVVLPRTALRGKDTVYVARDDNTLEVRPVKVAFSERERVVLFSGLTEGERAITSPVRGAADGMKINPVESIDLVSTDQASKTIE